MSSTSEIQKLYSVTMEVTAVVLAASEREAEEVFREHQSAILLDGDYEPDCGREIKVETDLPDGWEVDCLPYGCAERLSIGDWLDLAPPEVVRDTKTIDMFAEAPAGSAQ